VIYVLLYHLLLVSLYSPFLLQLPDGFALVQKFSTWKVKGILVFLIFQLDDLIINVFCFISDIQSVITVCCTFDLLISYCIVLCICIW
jgi:hypothetical protein